MTFINRETDYAIRIIRAISKEELCSIPHICETQYISKPFAHKISKKLEDGGIIGIKRGSRGGLFLACDTKKTSLWDLLNALDNKLYINECFQDGYKCECGETKPCRTHFKLEALQKRFNDELKALSLSEIL